MMRRRKRGQQAIRFLFSVILFLSVFLFFSQLAPSSEALPMQGALAPAANWAETPVPPPPDWKQIIPRVREFIQTAMKEWGVPGLAAVIVHEDRAIMADGFGFRDVERQLPVTAQTRFVLGSTTKAFTTLALSLLVEEGRMSWDEPVRNYLPEFALMDELATLRCTARDLVTHRTGVARHDVVWSGASLSPEEVVKALRFLEPSRDFRSAFQYNNLMYIAAGVLVSRVAGLPWEEFLKQRIFSPLGMKNSGCSLAEYVASPEYARSYSKVGEKLEAIPFPAPEQKIMYGPRASGSVHSTAADMGQWLQLHLGGGKVGDQRLISPERLQEMHTPQIVRPAIPAEQPEIEHPSYGLGWMIDSYRGHYRVYHGGETMGFSSFVVFFPREKFGAAILTNLSSPVATLTGNFISDLGLGLEPVDWKRKLASRQTPPSPPAPPPPAREIKPVRPLKEYTGEFIHPAYGVVKIESDGNRLLMNFRGESLELEPVSVDIFRPSNPAWRRFAVSFHPNLRGMIESLFIPFEPAVKAIEFQRKD